MYKTISPSKILFFIICLNCLTYLKVSAQSPSPIAFFTNPLQLNPAIMGSNLDVKGILDYRSQWAAIDNGYTTMNFNAMYPIMIGDHKGKLDIGAYFQRDAAGAYTTNNMGVAIDYNKEIAANNNLCFALSGGYYQQGLNTNGLTFDNQYVLGSFNPAIVGSTPLANQKIGFPVINAGLMWTFNKSQTDNLDAYVGISGFNLNNPNESMTGLSTAGLAPIWSIQAGIKMFSNQALDITPNLVLATQSGNIKSALGAKTDYKFGEQTKLIFGLWYGKSDGVSVMAGLFYKNFTLNYLYEVVTSNVGNQIGGGLSVNEIVLSYQFRTKKWSSANDNQGPNK